MVRTPEGRTRVVVAPIGIPHDEVRGIVESLDIMDRVRELQRAVGGRRIVLGVDRLDYTKGIPEKIAAFARLLEQEPSLIEELVLVQVVVPSREEVDAYSNLKRTLERVVGELNGRFGRTGRVAVHYLYQSLTPYELYAHYIASEVALVTPLRDGMNLVALEYIASRTLETGALVLSEFAGATEYLSDAYLVNPYDIDAVCNALKRALGAPDEERRRRMRGLRARVAELDVHRWADRFLAYLQRPPV